MYVKPEKGLLYLALTKSTHIVNAYDKGRKIVVSIIGNSFRGCHGRDHMVVGFITTYAISAYSH
jgi:hypothetical protein